MKKIFYLLFLIPFFATAQKDTTAGNRLRDRATGKNIIKINLSSFAFSNYSLMYERSIAKKISFSVGFRYMPKAALPYESNLQSAAGANANINFSLFQMGNTAITPEFRFYSHKNMRGFYIAPYGRYASFDLSLPVNYTYNSQSKNAVFSGTITSMSGGLMFGTQHNLGKNIIIDIWLIGAHAGSANGNLIATVSPAMSSQEQTALQQQLTTMDISPYKMTGTVTSATTATIDASGPWYGIRGLGINLGIRF